MSADLCTMLLDSFFFSFFAASEIHLSLARILVDDQTLIPGNTYKAWVADATSFDLFAFTNDSFMPQTNTQRSISHV